MAILDGAAYRPSQLAWSEGRRPHGVATCMRQMNHMYGTLESIVSVRVTAP